MLYNSTSYFDDLAWGAAWLHKRTRDPAYLAQAQVYHAAQLPYLDLDDPGTARVFDWNNAMPGVSYLLAEASGFKNGSYTALVGGFSCQGCGCAMRSIVVPGRTSVSVLPKAGCPAAWARAWHQQSARFV